MPWREVSRVEQRREFVRLALQEGANRRELCRRFGIHPDTAYKWLVRFGQGETSLADRSRRPHTSPAGAAGGAVDNAAGLAFILGFARSGTTLLGRILAAAPDVAVLEEKPLLAAAVAQFMTPADGVDRLAAQTDEGLCEYRDDFWRRAASFSAALRGKLVIDQTAFNTVYLPLIGRLFPRAGIVFAIRDPRDVVLSCFRRQFAPTPFTLEFHSLESATRFYCETMRLAQICREKMPLKIHDIRYEDLIADFDGESRRLCAFVGVPWAESLRDFHLVPPDRTLATRSAAQVRRGLNRDSVGRWRLYREQMEPVLAQLAPWVEKFGYEPD